MEELVSTIIVYSDVVFDKQNGISNANLELLYLDTNSSNMVSEDNVSLDLYYANASTDNRIYTENYTDTILYIQNSTDKLVYRETYAAFIGQNTWPLLNRTRRVINYYNFIQQKYYITNELMLINESQNISIDTNILAAKLRLANYLSNSLTINSSIWQYNQSTIPLKLLSLSNISSDIMLPTYGQAFTEYTKPKQLRFNNYISAILVELSAVQSIAYSPSQTVKYTSIGNKTYKSTIFTKLGTNFAFEQTANDEVVLQYSRYIAKLNNIRTNSQVINYGGENTFYSLNGFFNYFRYKYPSLMPTNFTILIGNKHINMYNSSMSCIESHKAGYKKITVSSSFLKDANNLWCYRDNLQYIFYENKLNIFYGGKIYTYYFDSLTFSNMSYYAMDSSEIPNKATLHYDVATSMPYICCNSAENSQALTPEDEFWNFLQINNIKDLQHANSAEEASYIHEIFTPTMHNITNILGRTKDSFILQGYVGDTKKLILIAEINNSVINEFFTYDGSNVLSYNHPYIYYSKLSTAFSVQSDYSSINRLNIETLDIDVIDINHSSCIIDKSDSIWIMYKRTDNGSFYVFKESKLDKKINLSVVLNLYNDNIIDFKAFNNKLYFITNSRKVYELDYTTLYKREIVCLGTPIVLIKFNNSIGAILTRKDTSMLFEELQPIDWTTNPNNWITPSDLKKGDILYPYTLALSSLLKRTANITTIGDFTTVERTSRQAVEKEFLICSDFTTKSSLEIATPVRVGNCSQLVLSEVNMTNTFIVQTTYGSLSNSNSIKVNKTLNNDGTFTLTIDDLNFPDSLQKGFKIYAR